MAKLRIGFSSDFTLDSSEVGIGTTNPTSKLQVVDTLKGDFNITGVSTLTVYGGFAAQKQNVTKGSSIGFSTTGIGTVGITSFISVNERETGFLSLVGEYNTVSDDIIVDEGKIFEVSTTNITGITTLGTQEVYAPDDSVVSVGTLESVSIQSHFSVPDGGSNDRPDQPVEGMVRFNDDLNTLEFYNGIEWRQFTVSGASGRAVFAGGDIAGYSPDQSKRMDYVNIMTLGNSINFGDLSGTERRQTAGCSSSTRGLFMGGQGPAGNLTDIDYITIASEGNSQDFGNLLAQRQTCNTLSSSTRGISYGAGEPAVNVIEYVEIPTLGSSLDFGDCKTARRDAASFSSPVRGICAGGVDNPGATLTEIEFITIASLGDGTDFGDLIENRRSQRGLSNSVRGIIAGGGTPTFSDVIQYITIASTGNAIYFGNLESAKNGHVGSANQTRGVFAGALQPTATNTIEYITIASVGDAIDFGDLSAESWSQTGACSDSHGGLGGF